MFLRQIKLSGFKSFVEPTVISFNSKLVGVVGPNGCGKSNVIDAVRWVMGESSAKNLRGESMADVIFNGSTQRKPVGQASIELVFENCGNLRGEYAAYTEICIRREVNRDGQSNYYLNGSRCRRRDIVDVFLGTGIGSRSYSIIGQGMVSQVIEADPYNLKNFIDEASGVSVYKVRRHETELRMKHTQENLIRINDLKAEQEKALEKLKRQAQTAERYHKLHKECELLEAKWLLLKLAAIETDNAQVTQSLQVNGVALEKVIAEITAIDSTLIKEKLLYEDKLEILQGKQRAYYALGEKVARLEQDLSHTKDQQEQHNKELSKLKQEDAELGIEKAKDTQELSQLEEELSATDVLYADSKKEHEAAAVIFNNKQQQYNEVQESWNILQKSLLALQNSTEITRQKITHLESLVKNAKLKETRLLLEQQQLGLEAVYNEYLAKKDILQKQEEQYQKMQQDEQQRNQALEALYMQLKALNSELDVLKDELQIVKGKHGALTALQEDSLKNEVPMELDFFTPNKLGEILKIEPGFELAVERALKTYLAAAVTMQEINASNLADILQHKVNTFTTATLCIEPTNKSSLIALAEKIIYPQEARNLVANFYVATATDDVFALVKELQLNEYMVTVDGSIFSANAIMPLQDTNSVLQRQVLLEKLQGKIYDLQAQVAVMVSRREQIEQQVKDIERQKQELQNTQQALQKELRISSSQVSSLQTKHQHLVLRDKQIQQEIVEQGEVIIKNAQEISELSIKITNDLEKIEVLQTQACKLGEVRDNTQRDHALCTENLHFAQKNLHTYEINIESLRQKMMGIKNILVRLSKQQETGQSRILDISASIMRQDPKIINCDQELQKLLNLRAQEERVVNEVQTTVSNIHANITDLENRRLEYEKGSNNQKEELNNLRLQQHSLLMQQGVQAEALNKLSVDLEAVKAQLDFNEDLSENEVKIASLKNKITHLGAINLAALEELAVEQEKHEYITKQIADLTEALATLEDAIRKIDKETKEKFMETFVQINANFQQLFPQLFGGGEAFLELTESDILQAGITVVARPPGKRNSTIHLLSGGEKALTAVAFIFAIFKLNPAPFCMLDEVDAPLDDTNVDRFCNMLKEMATEVQFIFITHNKITMEIAEQLCGVTMKEPGVSRLVAVNMNEAVLMAEA